MPSKRFADPTDLPEGFLYQPNFLSETEEADLLGTIETLEFGAYDFRGYIAKRRVVAYGGGYDSGTRRMAITDEVIPEFLRSIRDRAAAVVGMPVDEIVQAMVTEYSEGTPIGWHRDSPQFGTIIGISLRSLPPAAEAVSAPAAEAKSGRRQNCFCVARAPLDLRNARRCALEFPAQHSSSKGTAIFDHLT